MRRLTRRICTATSSSAWPTSPLVLLYQLGELGHDTPTTRAYRRAIGAQRSTTPADRLCYLELAAHELGLEPFLAAAPTIPLPRPWATAWTALLRQRLAPTIAGLDDGAADVITLPLAGRPAVAAASFAGRVEVLDAAGQDEGYPIAEFLPTSPAEHLAGWFATPERFLVARACPHRVDLFDYHAQTVHRLDVSAVAALVTTIAAVSYGDHEALVVGYADGSLAAYEPDGHCLATTSAHEGPVTTLSSSGHTLLSGGADGRARFWILEEGQWQSAGSLAEWEDVWVSASALLEYEHGGIACVGLSDGSVAWEHRYDDPESGEETVQRDRIDLHLPAGWKLGMHTVAPGNETHTISTVTNFGDNDYPAVLEDFRQSEERSRLEEGDDPPKHPTEIVRLFGGVNAVDAFRVGGRVYVVSGGEDGAVQVVEVTSDDPVEMLTPLGVPVSAVAFAGGETGGAVVVASAGRSGTITSFPVVAGDGPPFLPPVGERLGEVLDISAVVGGDGRPLVASALSTGVVEICDGTTGAKLVELEPSISLAGVSLLPWDGQLVLFAYGSRGAEDDAADAAAESTEGVVELWTDPLVAGSATTTVPVAGLTSVSGVEAVGDGFAVSGATDGDDIPLRLITPVGEDWDVRPLGDDLAVEPDFRPTGYVRLLGVLSTDDRGTAIVITDDHLVYSLDDHGLSMISAAAAQSAAHPVVSRGHGAILAGTYVVSLVALDEDVEVEEVDFRDEQVWTPITAITAAPDLAYVIAGKEDGRLLIWRRELGESPELAIRLAWPARQLVLLPPNLLLVRGDGGLHALTLDLGSAADS